MEDGYPSEDNPQWGISYLLECAPEKMTPETEHNLVNFFNQQGLPKSLSQCLVTTINKEFSFKAFLMASANGNEAGHYFIKAAISSCLSKLDLPPSSYQDEKYTTNKTVLGGTRGKRNSNYNEDYAEDRTSGIGDGLAGLLGGGGIATQAKGSIRTPSERDIDVSAGGGARSAADILKVVRMRTPGLRHVYNKYLKIKPNFQGKVTLRFTIAPEGEISNISIASSTTGYKDFDNEIKSSVSRWKFSKVKNGSTTVTIPFTFSE